MNSVTFFATTVVRVAVPISIVFAADPTTGPEHLIQQLSGTWKMNEAKRKLGSGLDLRFRTNPAGKLEELRGPELRPIIQPVDFTGKPYNDGEMTIVWKQSGPNSYERTLSQNGKVGTTRRIRVSSDGQTLTEEFDSKKPDGKTVTRTAEYRKASGEAKGLSGTWKVVSIRNSEPPVMKYVPTGKNALTVTTSQGQTYVLTLDGKPASITGGAVIPDMMISGRVIDGNTFETTTTRQGVPVTTARIQLSDGGKVMTVTATNLRPGGGGEPAIAVFERQ